MINDAERYDACATVYTAVAVVAETDVSSSDAPPPISPHSDV